MSTVTSHIGFTGFGWEKWPSFIMVFIDFLLITTGERTSHQDYQSSFSIVESSSIYMPIGDSNALLLEPISGQWTLVIL